MNRVRRELERIQVKLYRILGLKLIEVIQKYWLYFQEAADEDAEAHAEDEKDERFELIEFAENYFNDHEKSPQVVIFFIKSPFILSSFAAK